MDFDAKHTLRALKGEMKGMEKNRKGHLLIAAALISIVAISGVSAVIYFNRTLHHGFSVIGITADILNPGFDGYDLKQVAGDLTNNQVSLTIYSENFYNIWLNLTYTTNATGLRLNVTAQYYQVYWHTTNVNLGWTKMFVPLESPFEITLGTPYTVNKTLMMYSPLVKPNLSPGNGGDSNTGYCMVLSFVYDTEFITVPGNYDSALLFELGFV